jgi:hypothetical protein
VHSTDIGIRVVVIAAGLIGLYVWSPLVGVAVLAIVFGYVLAQRTVPMKGPVRIARICNVSIHVELGSTRPSRCSPSVLYAGFLGVLGGSQADRPYGRFLCPCKSV